MNKKSIFGWVLIILGLLVLLLLPNISFFKLEDGNNMEPMEYYLRVLVNVIKYLMISFLLTSLGKKMISSL